MSHSLSCPACGGEVKFQSTASVFAVCPYCRMSLIRKDKSVESYGKMADLPPDMSPFQIGTTGSFESKRFTMVGKIKLAWEHGIWNEWYAVFDDGTSGWLAEAQGFLMFTRPMDTASLKLPSRGRIRLREPVSLGKEGTFIIDDIKPTICQGSEGELPFTGAKDRQSTNVDCSGPNGKFATLDYSDEGLLVFAGRYVDFDDFKFGSLRDLDGW